MVKEDEAMESIKVAVVEETLSDGSIAHNVQIVDGEKKVTLECIGERDADDLAERIQFHAVNAERTD